MATTVLASLAVLSYVVVLVGLAVLVVSPVRRPAGARAAGTFLGLVAVAALVMLGMAVGWSLSPSAGLGRLGPWALGVSALATAGALLMIWLSVSRRTVPLIAALVAGLAGVGAVVLIGAGLLTRPEPVQAPGAGHPVVEHPNAPEN